MHYLLFFNLLKIRTFVAMTDQFVNIHTHRPTGRGIELRTAGIHPWDADKEDIAALGTSDQPAGLDLIKSWAKQGWLHRVTDAASPSAGFVAW